MLHPKDNAVVLALPIGFQLTETFKLFTGPAVELDKHSETFVWTLGAKSIFDVGHGWEMGPFAEITYREDYETLAAGLAVGKTF